MSAVNDSHRKLRQSLQWTQATCVFFGLGMLLWGLAPAVITRAVTGQLPMRSIEVGGISLFLGTLFIALGAVAGRNVGWAIWTALGISIVLCLGNLALLMLGGDSQPSIFPALMAACTAGTSWLALQTRKSTGLTDELQPSS